MDYSQFFTSKNIYVLNSNKVICFNLLKFNFSMLSFFLRLTDLERIFDNLYFQTEDCTDEVICNFYFANTTDVFLMYFNVSPNK